MKIEIQSSIASMKRIALFVLFAFQLIIIPIPGYSKPDKVIAKNFPVQDGRVKVKKDELPETAKKILNSDQFKGWSIVNIYKTKEGEYEVELKKGDTTQAVKFDKEGNIK